VPSVTSTVLIAAAVPSVAAAVREHGSRPGEYPVPGAEVEHSVRLAPGLRTRIRWRLAEVELLRLRRTQVGGPPLNLAHTSVLTPTAAGTRLTETLQWTPQGTAGGALGLLCRRVARAELRRTAQRIRVRAEQLHAAPAVVAAALLHDGRVLAQQRARPAELAGRWELPGGRVEPGERARDALVRECQEELAVRVVAGGQLGPDVPLPGGLVLRVHCARLADPQARPQAVEHAALRWVDAADLHTLDWLDADRAVLADLATTMRG
jgi:8-oxo-dGTP diphosphatase